MEGVVKEKNRREQNLVRAHRHRRSVISSVVGSRLSGWQRAVLLVGLAVVVCAAQVVLFLIVKPLPGSERVPAGWLRNSSHYLTMSDGTRIAADVWLPAELQPGERVPVLLRTTRYWRAHAVGPLYRLLVSLGREQVPNLSEATSWNRRGYALVLVDARGSGASFGQRPVEWSDAEVADAGRVIDWISSRPWSNGRVGTYGVSYDGNTAELSTVPNHPALGAVAPLFSDFDPLFYLAMPGGVYNRGFIEVWNAANQALDANDVCALEQKNGLQCWWTKLAVPGVKPVERGLLGEAVESHHTLELAEALQRVDYRDDGLKDADISIGDVSPYGRLPQIEAAKVPMFVRVSWLDAATADGALARYLTSDTPQQLVIGAWSHGGYDDADPFKPRLSYPEPRIEEQHRELAAFFERTLKEDGGPPPNAIRYTTMNEGRWRTTRTWPPSEVETQRWYLGTEYTLTTTAASATGHDTYTVDFTASSGEKTRWHTNMGGGDVFYPDRAQEDAKLLSYTGPPLGRDLRITGTPVVSLELASTHPDGALHIYLEDVAPDGRVTYLTEGILRLIHGANEEANVPYWQLGPRRTFRRADAKPSTPGEVRRVEVPLYATSVRLRAGHRLRVAIAGHDASLFARYPADGVPTLLVERSTGQASYLELPVAED